MLEILNSFLGASVFSLQATPRGHRKELTFQPPLSCKKKDINRILYPAPPFPNVFACSYTFNIAKSILSCVGVDDLETT